MAKAAAAAAPHVRFQVPLVAANFVTVPLESLLYGTFLVLAVVSIYLLIQRERGDSKWMLLRKPMFLASILLCVTCTGHWILTVTHSFLSFVTFSSGEYLVMGGPLYFLADLHQTTEIAKNGFVVACIAIGDAVLIYRLWIIFNRSIVIILFPMCTLLGHVVCGTGLIYQLTRLTVGQDIVKSAAQLWLTVGWVFTLITNFYCTATIGWRIYCINKTMGPHRYGGISYMSTVAAVVESGAIYVFWAILFLATFKSGSNLQSTILDMGAQIIGIVFMLINVRVGLGWALTGRSTPSGGGTQTTVRSGSGGRLGGNDDRSLWGLDDIEGAIGMVKNRSTDSMGAIQTETT